MANISNNEQHWKLFLSMLNEIRKEKNIKLEDLSAATGYSVPSLSRFFKGVHSPGLDVFINVARALRVNFFFEDKESVTDLSVIFNKAMDKLGRNPENLNLN